MGQIGRFWALKVPCRWGCAAVSMVLSVFSPISGLAPFDANNLANLVQIFLVEVSDKTIVASIFVNQHGAEFLQASRDHPSRNASHPNTQDLVHSLVGPNLGQVLFVPELGGALAEPSPQEVPDVPFPGNFIAAIEFFHVRVKFNSSHCSCYLFPKT